MCCGNAGENVAFKKVCKQEGLGLALKYIALGMPQQNDCIEQKVTTLFKQVCIMLGGRFNTYLQNGI